MLIYIILIKDEGSKIASYPLGFKTYKQAYDHIIKHDISDYKIERIYVGGDE